jgi:hypothetical protein
MRHKEAGMRQQIGQWFAISSLPWLAHSALPRWQQQSDTSPINSISYFLSYNETALPPTLKG